MAVNAKPDLRASEIMTSLLRSVSPNSRVAPNVGGTAFEIFQQRRADAMTLPPVVDRETELDAGA